MRPDHQIYDVVVVGARVAGSATAKLLAEQGLRVIAIDRSGYGSDTLSTHAMLGPGVELLNRWGILDKVRDAGTPSINTVTFHYEEMDPVYFDLAARPLLAPRRTVLDRLLVDNARSAGAEVLFDTRVTEVSHRSDGAVGGVVVNTKNGPVALTSRLVIGADGVGSFVARSVSAPITHSAPNSTASVMAYFDGLQDRGYQWYFARKSSAGTIATNDGLSHVFASVPSHRFRSTMRNDIASSFALAIAEAATGLADELGSAKRVTSFRSFPGVPGFARKPYGPGWALVGDAGAFADPIGAHGMTAALRDAVLCSAATVRALEHPSEGIEAWSRYERERDEITIPLIDSLDLVASYEHSIERVQEEHVKVSKLVRDELNSIQEPESRAA